VSTWSLVAAAVLLVALGLGVGAAVARARLQARYQRLQASARALLDRGRPLVGLPPVTGQSPDDLAFALDQLGTAWQHAWLETQEERRRLQSVLAGLTDGVLLLDRWGRVLLANEAVRAIWPRLSPRLIGMSQIALFQDAELDAALSRSRNRGQPETVLHVLPGPPRRYLEVRILPLPEPPVLRDLPAPGHAVAGTLLLVRDVTERHAVDQMRRDFVANVSHELQTPLTTIRGFAETLVEDPDLPAAERQRFLALILAEARRMSDLVRDLLELARLEAPVWRAEPEPVDLAATARDVLAASQPLAERRGIALGLEEDGPAVVQGRADELRRALTNLVDNALRYTPPGGRVTVRVGRDEQGAYMAVRDTGIGIPAEEQGRIFERFYRVAKGRSRDGGGTGLGLAIVKHVVESHGGRVLVESAPGEGSTFTCRFPPA
jgi:two-component system phosphate regulon sensor histidine kinase PhoR